jgi:poly-gamma-glutamate synthesis protein (capsule biosynthesis protein)
MVEKGADAIIGSHPHVIQDYQEINGVPVAYSLGNAVSNMSVTNTQLELMATLKIVRYHNGDLEMLTPEFKYLWCSLPGGYNDSYTVIPVEDFLDKRDQWHGKWDYDKMVKTYNNIKR